MRRGVHRVVDAGQGFLVEATRIRRNMIAAQALALRLVTQPQKGAEQ
jgi:hypothetical protein